MIALAVQPIRIAVVRVFADASPRQKLTGWGAVVVADGYKPHVMGGRIRSRRDTAGAEAVAMILARNSARRWVRRHGIRAELLVVHSDNQSVATALMLKNDSARVTYRWVARDHPMMRLAHSRARMS